MASELKLTEINIKGGTQPRAKIDLDVVAEYAERLDAGDVFPPVEVVFDGKEHWLWDGFHRFHGHTKAGRKSIACNVRQGTARDAVLFSCGANGHHGIRRTNDDKRNAVKRLLEDVEWAAKSNRWVAEQCAVSDMFVGKVRSEIQVQTVCTSNSTPENTAKDDAEPPHYTSEESQEEQERKPPKPPAKRKGKDGKSYPAKPAAAKKTKPPKDDEGGFEPHEAQKPLGEIDKLLTKIMGHFSTAEKILGKPALAAVHSGLDSAYKALTKVRGSLRRAK